MSSDKKVIPKHYESAEFEEEVASYQHRLRGTKLTAAIAFITGTGFTLFGYDQGQFSSSLPVAINALYHYI